MDLQQPAGALLNYDLCDVVFLYCVSMLQGLAYKNKGVACSFGFGDFGYAIQRCIG
jgi:hypothetical protein